MYSATAQRLARLAAIGKTRAHLDGQEAAFLAELAALPDAAGKEWIREDVAVAMRLPPMTAHQRHHRHGPEATAKVEACVLARAGTQTLAQFSRSLRRAVTAHDRRTADDLADRARAARHY